MGLRFHDNGMKAYPQGSYLFETFGPLTNRNNLALPPDWNGMTDELIKMKRVLSPINYYPTYTRQIVDSWDIHSKLGDKLLAVAQEYKKLK